MGIASWYSYRV